MIENTAENRKKVAMLLWGHLTQQERFGFWIAMIDLLMRRFPGEFELLVKPYESALNQEFDRIGEEYNGIS